MSPRSSCKRRPLAAAIAAGLAGFIALAPASKAQANEECGSSTGTDSVTCQPGATPYPAIRYTGVSDFEVVLGPGVVVDGSLAEPDTTVVLYGEGALTLSGEEGTVIRSQGFPAVDVVSNSGPVTVRLDEVYGGSVGIAALARGDVTISANHVEGDIAILAESLGGDISVVAGQVRGGEGGAGILANTENGSVDVAVGYAAVEGNWSQAILAQSWEGGDVTVNAGTAYVRGLGAAGIVGAAGTGDVDINVQYVYADTYAGVGIAAYAFDGAAVVTTDSVGVEGDYSRAIDIGARYDVLVDAETVITAGLESNGVNVETTGDVTVDIGRVATYGDYSYGVSVLTGGDVHLDLDEITTWGLGSSALFAGTDSGNIDATVGQVVSRAETGDWFTVGLSSNTGNVALTVEQAVVAYSGWAITGFSMFGGVQIGVDAGALVYGETTAINASSAEGTRIDIAGTVDSGTGPVIEVFGTDFGGGDADIRVAATGTLRGRLLLSGGDDALANAGRFLTSGESVFGAGDDVLSNLGLLALRSGDDTAIRFTGLEELDNRGLVSLANDRTGDSFAMDGTLQGGAGSTLALDLDLADGSADHVAVGDFGGTTAIHLNLVGSGSGLGLDGILLASSDGDDTGHELVLAGDSLNRGFIGFRLRYDGHENWLLESDLNDASYLAAALPAGVRGLWRMGTDTVSSHLQAARGAEGKGGAWAQVVGGEFEGESRLAHAEGSRVLGWEGSHSGLQLGAEAVMGHWRAGATAGFGEAEMDLGGAERTRFDALNLGLYAHYENNGWFGNAVLRGEKLDLESEWASIGLEGEGDATSLGLRLEAGRRFSFERAWIEPLVRVSWVNTDLPDQEAQYGDILREDGSAVTGEIGLRLGAEEGWLGLPLRPYVAMSFAREFGGDDQTVFDMVTEQVVVTDEGERTYGQFAGGLAFRLGRVDLNAEVETQFGDLEGTTARLGARITF